MYANSQRKRMRGLIVLPSVGSYRGDVNEELFARTISRFIDVTTISFIYLHSLLLSKLMPYYRLNLSRRYLASLKSDINLMLLLPLPLYPYVAYVVSSIFYGLILFIIVLWKRPHFVYIRPSLPAFPLVALKRIHKSKVLVKIHTISELENKYIRYNIPVDVLLFSFFNSKIERYIIQYADRVIVPSKLFYRQLCIRRRTTSPNPPIIMPAGVTLDKIRRIRSMGDRDHSEFKVGFIGSLVWWQGVDVLIEAASLLVKQHKIENIRIIIVGDGPEKGRLERLCLDLGVRCTFTGQLSHDKALEMLASFDVLVVPSRRNINTLTILPIKILEAWALGVPVVAANHPVYQSFQIRNMEHIILCDATPQSVADAVALLYSDRTLREKIVSKAKELVMNFTYETYSRRIIEAVAN